MSKITNVVHTIDLHAAGEPGRIIYDDFSWIPGKSMRDRLDYLKTHEDTLRQFLMQEPRGHKDMFGAILLPPITPEADAGIIYLNSDGYLDMCVHGTICAARAMVELNRPLKDPNMVVFDTVGGHIRAALKKDNNGRVISVTVQNLPSFVFNTAPLFMDIDGLGTVKADIVFAGNFFVVVEELKQYNLLIKPENATKLIEYGLKIRDKANALIKVQHPLMPSTKEIALAVFYSKKGDHPLHVKNTVVFADGQMDRSPCGSGTSALMTYFHSQGELPLNTPYISESIIGSQFQGTLINETNVGDFPAVIPQVTGASYLLGRHEFIREEEDPFHDGFLINHHHVE